MHDRFTIKTQDSLELASKLALDKGHGQIEPLHILNAFRIESLKTPYFFKRSPAEPPEDARDKKICSVEI